MDWEKSYAEGAMPWDLGEAAPPLLEILDGRPSALWGNGVVLVPGAGRGHDARALALAGHRVLALDIAPTAVALAEGLCRATEGLTILEGDFLDPDLPAAWNVSAIFEHTCFCALPPHQRGSYVEAAARWLPAGGHLVGVFFIDPPPREDGLEGPPFRVRRDEVRRLFDRHFGIEREALPGRSTPERAGREWLVEFVRKC
jgi:SAM-dependent methyltransferase